MSNGEKSITISDIAIAAGVSKTTVSRYLNGQYNMMSSATRDRIEAVIEVSNYKPNYVARSLRSKQTDLIGVILSDISTPFSTSLISGMSSQLEDAGYVPVFVDCSNSAEKEKKYIQNLIDRGVAGLIVKSCSNDNPFLIELDCRNIPIVLCSRLINDHSFPAVITKAKQPLLDAVGHLHDEGFDAPYLFTYESGLTTTRTRRHDAFLEAVSKIYGIDDPIINVRHFNAHRPQQSVEYIRQIIDGADRPQSIICVNHMATFHVLSLLKQMRISIPDQIGVCGVDDWDMSRDLDWLSIAQPTVTRLSVSSKEMGRSCARLLLERIEDPKQQKRVLELDCPLIIRESTMLGSRVVQSANGHSLTE